MLSSVLPKLNIKYRHFPGLGVGPESRRNLNTQADYKLLFQDYSESLMERKEELESLKQLIEAKRRIALTCFEADSEQCHRHCISDFLHNEYHYYVEHFMMKKLYTTERILITVKTYPTLSKKYAELVCTAGVNETGEWRRIYPVPFRQLNRQ